MAEHQIVIHGVGGDPSDGRRCELDKGVVLGATCGTVARETKAGNFAELGEIGAHFVLVETMRNAAKRGTIVSKRSESYERRRKIQAVAYLM
jgi:hypothetical protein